MIARRPQISAAVQAAIASSSFNSRAAKSLTGSIAVALSFGLGTAHAQNAPTNPSANAPATLEEVTVTGSRIKRTNDFNTPTPTTVIDSDMMESLGIVNVGESLTVTPANISTNTPAATGNANFFTGSYIADLRGLNPYFGSRTLTLVNTRRMVQTNQGDSVDLNFIPQILVSRIDTVTGGASAAYGSGAIAGVVNVILDNKLEGGKITADWYETSHSDAKDRHVGVAYGHGLFNDRVHFVIGGEYENQDSLGCETVRSWCAENRGFYQGTSLVPGITPLIEGTNIRSNQLNTNGVFFNPSPTATTTLQATPDGTATTSFGLGLQPYGSVSRNVAPGGDGDPLYAGGAVGYTNLMAPVNRGVISGMVTAALTDTINFSADVNWGKVTTTNYNGGNNDFGDAISKDNGFIQGDPALLAATGAGASINKDWTAQVPALTRFTTDVKRFSVGFDGKFGQSSWSWDTYYTYGLTEREQLVQDTNHFYEEFMALDSVIGPNGQPECRVTRDGSVGAAIGDSLASGDGFPTYGLASPASWAALAQGCVPLNPFGTQPLSQSALAYSWGNLDERLRYEQTVVAFNASGDIFRGIGAGAFSLAAGFEWRQEVGHNDERYCAPTDAHCQASITDFLIQYGAPFGGGVTVKEGYVEANLPLLKNVPFANLLEIDLAGRESRYTNKSLYAINVVPGTEPEFSHNLTTWKVSGIYEPVEWFRFRGSQSRDARAGNFRELYYGQVISAGGIFGYCNPGGLGGGGPTGANLDPCTQNLEGNTNLRPETSDTTTLGFVFSPKSVLPGFQFSADWFHIKINDAIEQANSPLLEQECKGGDATACSAFVFNPTVYPDGTSGAAAWQAGHYNISVVNAPSYNGAFYEVKGADLSLNYVVDLGKAGSLNTRLLATWMDEQKFAQCTNVTLCPVNNILGWLGTGPLFVNDYQPDAKWRGNFMITWSNGPLSLTPNVSFVSHGVQDYLGVTPAQGALYQQALTNPNLLAPGLDLHPMSNNYVPSYFLVNLNATYQFEDVSALKGLQLFVQVNNVFNKTPPFADGSGPFGVSNSYGGTNPVFYDTLGLAWRAGFRLKF